MVQQRELKPVMGTVSLTKGIISFSKDETKVIQAKLVELYKEYNEASISLYDGNDLWGKRESSPYIEAIIDGLEEILPYNIDSVYISKFIRFDLDVIVNSVECSIVRTESKSIFSFVSFLDGDDIHNLLSKVLPNVFDGKPVKSKHRVVSLSAVEGLNSDLDCFYDEDRDLLGYESSVISIGKNSNIIYNLKLFSDNECTKEFLDLDVLDSIYSDCNSYVNGTLSEVLLLVSFDKRVGNVVFVSDEEKGTVTAVIY